MNNFDHKIRPLTRKMIYFSVLPSNHFRTHKHPRERERERARRESRKSELDRASTPDASVRSRRRDRPVEIVPHEACRHLTGLIAHDPPMTDLSLDRSPSPFPAICDHSLFLLPLSILIFEPGLIVAAAL